MSNEEIKERVYDIERKSAIFKETLELMRLAVDNFVPTPYTHKLISSSLVSAVELANNLNNNISVFNSDLCNS